MAPKIVDQPNPTSSPDLPDIMELVREDLKERQVVGLQRYGTPLQPFNGRRALVDAYQESLDMAAYLRQQLWEDESTWGWLKSTKELQEDTYGYNLAFYASLADPEETARYLDWNTTAAVQELAEVREEFSWKPWATDEAFVNRDRIRDEVIDVMHFLANILTGLGVDDAELEVHYRLKQAKNRRRHDSGNYSARKGGLAKGSENE
jgi:hypothetical protein